MNPSEMKIENMADGTVRITITGSLPAASIAENPKWPYTPWNVSYQQGMLQKEAPRVLQTVANLRYVEGVVAARKAARAEKSAETATPEQVVAAAAPATFPSHADLSQPPAEAPAPSRTSAPAPTPAAKSSKKSRKARS
jgi:hypothetical protein